MKIISGLLKSVLKHHSLNVFRHLVIVGAIVATVLNSGSATACTSAIVGADRSASGATLLWKHRDTGAKYNYISHHEATDSTYEYIALHNYDDTEGSEAWMGMNRAGLVVFNTASYNLAPDTAAVKDREGVVMTMALRTCLTVDDFEQLLVTLPRPMGIQANFGVTDAGGVSAWFEAYDHGYKRYDVDPGDVVVRTNYSHSGGNERRLGLAREQTARRLLDSTDSIAPLSIINSLSKRWLDPVTGRDVLASGPCDIIDTGDYIPRYISTASIVVECVPSEQGDGSNYIMWSAIGYPVSAEVYRVTFDNIPTQVLPGPDNITPSEHQAEKFKNSVYTGKYKNNKRIISCRQLLQP